MLYDSYYKKISKIADFWKKVFKHIVPISISIGVVLAALIAFMATKGIVFDDKNQSGKIELVYGKPISMNASALFSDVSYEYSSNNGSTWSEKAPVLPGNYQVRAVAKGFFGQVRHGKVYSLVIAPKAIDVKVIDPEGVYGELLNVGADLSYGDVISCGEFAFTYDNISEYKTVATPIVGAVKILNKNGEDVTKAYTLKAVGSEVKLNKRPVTVFVEDKGTVYNGKKLTYDGCETISGALAYNDKLMPEFDESKYPVDVGVTENAPVLTIRSDVTDKNGEPLDVTHLYEIKTEVGKLSIDYRPLIIETESAKKVYDGKPFEYPTYKIVEGSLAEDQKISYTFATAITNVGTADNVLSFDIKDAQENSTFKNYSVIYKWGSLDVSARPITIKTPDASKVYDGKELTSAEYVISEGSLVEGHVIEVVETSSITNVGEVKNNIKIVIKNADGEDVTENYNISYVPGTFKITPFEITVSSDSGSWIYDGQAHSANINCSALFEGHEIRFSEQPTVIDFTSTKVDNKVTVEAIFDANGNNVLSNYKVNYGTFGTLEILKRKVSLTMESIEKTYDGEEMEFDSFEINSDSAYGFVVNEEFRPVVNKFYLASDTPYANKVLDYTVHSISRDVDVTANYEIEATDGTIKINRRVIELEFANKTKEYDAQPLTLTDADYVMRAEELPVNHKFDFKFIGSQTNVGKYEGATADLVNTKIIRGESEDVTANFIITANSVSLEVTLRNISLVTGSESKEYFGEVLTNETFEIVGGSLVEGHIITPTFADTASIINVGTAVNEATFVIVDAQGTPVNDNYNISCDFGTLEITPYVFNFIVEKAEKYYDSIPLTLTSYKIDRDDFPSGHTINIKYIGEQTEIGRCEYATVDIANTKIARDADGFDATGNFIFNANVVTLTVLPPLNTPVEVKPIDKTFIYDGAEHMLEAIFENETFELLESLDYVITYEFNTKYIEAGTYDITEADYTFKITRKNQNGEDVDVTEHFKLEFVDAKLIIEKREIVFELLNKTQPYNGEALTLDEDDCVSGTDQLNSLPVEHEISFAFVGSQTDVGSSEGYVEIVSIIRKDGENAFDAMDNFIITFVPEKVTLTVTQRPITVITPTDSRVYNGEWFSNSDINQCQIVNGSLVLDHVLALKPDAQIPSIKDAGSISNKLEFVIVDANGENAENITANYDIMVVSGRITIEPFEIKVTLKDKVKVFGENGLTKLELDPTDVILEYDIENWPQNHELKYSFEGSLEAIGIYRDATAQITVELSGEDITKNFNISPIEPVDIIFLPPEGTTIVIKPIDSEVIYDAGFHVPGGLEENDFLKTLMDIGYTFTIVDYDGEMRDVIFDESGNVLASEIGVAELKITLTYEHEGELYEIDNEYFDIDYQKGTLKILPRDLIFELSDKSKDYDGDALTLNEENCKDEIDRAAATLPDENHKLEITYNGSCTNVKESPADAWIDVRVIRVEDGVETDVTHNFNVIAEHVSLIIKPRKITVYTGGSEKTYDGKPLSNGDYGLLVGKLIGNDSLERLSEVPEWINAGTYTNGQTIIVVDENGEESANYQINYAYGKIVINPFKITVEFADKMGYFGRYDSFEFKLNWNDATVTPGRYDLPDNHVLQLEFIGSLDTIGICDATAKATVVYEDDGTLVPEQNFDITVNTVKLIAYPVKNTQITLKPVDVLENLYYDGNYHTATAFEETGDDDFLNKLRELGFEISIPADGYTGGGTLTGTYITRIDLSKVKITFNGEDTFNGVRLTEYFRIRLASGTLKIDKRKLNLTFNDKEDHTDITLSKEIMLNDSDLSRLSPKLPEGHEISFLNGAFIGVSELGIHTGNFVDVSKIRVYNSNGQDVTSSFDISVDDVTLTVLPPEHYPITLKPQDKTDIIYDGKYHSADALEKTDALLVLEELGYTFTVEYGIMNIDSGSVRNVGNYESFIKEGSVKVMRGGEDVTDWFDITREEGNIKISPLEITIIVDPTEKTRPYIEGESLEFTLDDCIVDLPEGHTLQLEFINADYPNDDRISITDVGVIYVAIREGSIVILDANGENVNGNFIINYSTEDTYKLEITTSKVTIVADSQSWPYDGLEHSCPTYKIFDEYGTEITFTTEEERNAYLAEVLGIESVVVSGSITNAGSVPNTVSVTLIEGVSTNYEVYLENGELTVTKLKITVQTGSASREDDGTDLTCGEFTFKVTDQHGNDLDITLEQLRNWGVEIVVTGIITAEEAKGAIENPVIKPNEVELRELIDGAASNFEFVCDSLGNLSIRPKGKTELKIYLSSTSKTYGGMTPWKIKPFVEFEDDSLTDVLELVVTITMPGQAEQITVADLNDIGSVKHGYLSFEIVDKDGNDCTDKYYLTILPTFGDQNEVIAEIMQKGILFTTGTASDVYSEGKKLSDDSVVCNLASSDPNAPEGLLTTGDMYSISVDRQLTVLDKAGTIINELYESDIIITDANGNSVKDNYRIIILPGELTLEDPD